MTRHTLCHLVGVPGIGACIVVRPHSRLNIGRSRRRHASRTGWLGAITTSPASLSREAAASRSASRVAHHETSTELACSGASRPLPDADLPRHDARRPSHPIPGDGVKRRRTEAGRQARASMRRAVQRRGWPPVELQRCHLDDDFARTRCPRRVQQDVVRCRASLPLQLWHHVHEKSEAWRAVAQAPTPRAATPRSPSSSASRPLYPNRKNSQKCHL